MKTSTKVIIGAVIALTVTAVLAGIYFGKLAMLRNSNDSWKDALSLFKYTLEIDEETHGLSRTYHYTVTDDKEPDKEEQTYDLDVGFFGFSEFNSVVNWLDKAAPRWGSATRE